MKTRWHKANKGSLERKMAKHPINMLSEENIYETYNEEVAARKLTKLQDRLEKKIESEANHRKIAALEARIAKIQNENTDAV
jgi:hypothetical protein